MRNWRLIFVGWTTTHLRIGTKVGNTKVMERPLWKNEILLTWDQPNDFLHKTKKYPKK